MFCVLQSIGFPQALPLDGCHTCRPHSYPRSAMVVHAQTRGVVKDFLGWYSVMVSAAERHSAESDDGKETDAVHMAFQQDKTYFEVTQPQVIMK